MKKISFSKETRAEIVGQIQRYFHDELDQEIGSIPAELLLSFFAETVGAYYYNQGLADAQAVFAKSLDEVSDRIYSLEQREARLR
ncbi:MAG TPA: DUF2164 domain-containing protein [Devosiaceae bacterium]|nr:DUF2164 domain-containing protein [Devosiaceae bacterium]